MDGLKHKVPKRVETPYSGDLPITIEEMFEVWLRLPERDLRTLQKVIKAKLGIKPTLAKLQKIATLHHWVDKAFAAEMLHEQQTNKEAYESIREKQVRRRAESLEIVGEIYDKTLRSARVLVNSKHFQKVLELRGTPRDLQTMVNSLLRIAELQERMMPVYAGPEGPEPGNTNPLLDGPVNPLSLAQELQRLANRQSLNEIRQSALTVEPTT